jgi:hypothetical protein
MRPPGAIALACLLALALACKGAAVVEQPEVEGAKSAGTAKGGECPKTACEDTTMAIVGGEAIPMSDFELVYSLERGEYERASGQRILDETASLPLQKDINTHLIYFKKLELECRRLGIDYDEATLAARMAEEQHGERSDSVRMGKIAAMRKQVLLDHGGRLEVPAEEVADFYESERASTFDDQARVRLGHAIITIEGPANDTDTLALAEEIFERASAGEDYDQLSHDYDGRRQHTEQGGEIRIRFYEDIEYEQPSIISELVRTKDGYHVILVLDRYPPGELPFAAMEDELRADLEGLRHMWATEVLYDDLSKYEVENCMAARAQSRGLAW